MKIIDFSTQFPDEQSCREHFRDSRIRHGIICKKCGSTKHYWLQNRWQFKCKQCDFRTTLRSGTVMEHSNLPIRAWYVAMCFMTSTKKGISACELQRQLGISQYVTVWKLMHKIRAMMGKCDDKYKLKDSVEFDEGFFSVAISSKDRNKLKRGKGSERQVNVAVLAESVPLEDIETGKQNKFCGHFKLKIMTNQKSEAVDAIFNQYVNTNSIVFSDMALHYKGIENNTEQHIKEKSTKETTAKFLKWVHIAIANAKRNFLGVYHHLKAQFLQNYLDEFSYKLNRRFRNNMLDLLIFSGIY